MLELTRLLTIISLYRLTSIIKPNIIIYVLLKIYEFLLFPFRQSKHKKNSISDRITNCLYDLGPIYTKFGQTLSTRPDIVGEELANQLRNLQDKLPAFSFAQVKSTIENEFGLSLEELFQNFEEEPIAAASISQVHKAVTKKGVTVAVKILRPNIEQIYTRDIKMLFFVAQIANKFLSDAKRLKPKEVVMAFEDAMKSELNLMLEAAASTELTENTLHNIDVIIPKIFWELTTNKILTMEWIDAISIYDLEKINKLSIDIKLLVQKIAIMFFTQAYQYGFFHADLHPGNIMVNTEGKIVLFDFGIMGRLPEKDRLAVAEILYAFLQRDYKRVAEIHIEVGYVPLNTNVFLFAQACRMIGEPIVGMSAKEISVGTLLTKLFKMTKDFGMTTQTQLLMLQKTTVVVEGIGRMLDPEINLWMLAEPWIKKWAIKNISPEAKFLRAIKKLFAQL